MIDHLCVPPVAPRPDNQHHSPMPDTWVTDMTHFLDDGAAPIPVPAARRRLADQLAAIVESATANPLRAALSTGVRCRRRPGHRPCEGDVRASFDGDSNILWHCSACGDQGLIHHWQNTPWDRGRAIPVAREYTTADDGAPASPMERPAWSLLKQVLGGMSGAEVMKVVRDLHDLSAENRRFLRDRLLSPDAGIEDYRQQIRDAIYPDPFSRKPISIAAAKRAIRLYARATGDLAGTLHLELSFVEDGTAHALDIGFGDDRYFAALESMLTSVLEKLPRLPRATAEQFRRRLEHLRDEGRVIGWGYGDFLSDRLAEVLNRGN